MKVLITEGSIISNIGSAALVENAVNIVQNKYPNAEVIILCQHSKSVSQYFNEKFIVLNELFIFPNSVSKLHKLSWLLNNLLWIIFDKLLNKFLPREIYTFSKKKKETLSVIKTADLVFCIGAERLNENFYKTAYLSAYMLRIIQSYNKPLIHLSLTLGPLKSNYLINIIKDVLNNSKCVFVRDNKSYELAIEIGILKKLLIKTYDIALLQNTIPLNHIESLYGKYGISKEVPIVGLSVLKWNYINSTGKSRYLDYIQSFAKANDYLIETHNVQIVFIPTNLPVFGNSANDNTVANDIINNMLYKNKCIVVPDLLKPAELKGMFSLMEFCIVTRMHAAILCTGANTPVISINYQYKLYEYMKHLSMENYSIDIDYLTISPLIELIDKMWINKSILKQALNSRINEMQIDLKQKLDNYNFIQNTP